MKVGMDQKNGRVPFVVFAIILSFGFKFRLNKAM
jgi:hypothetical protein